MAIDPHQMLSDEIANFLTFAWPHRELLDDPYDEVGDQIASRLHDVNELALPAARAHDYLHLTSSREEPDSENDSWGRRLTLRTLSTLGIVGLLRGLPQPMAPAHVVADIAAYLAGPPVACERMVVIDADLPLSGVHDVAGWQLTRVSPADLERLTPLPSTRQFAADPWDEALGHGGCTVLSRIDVEVMPRVSTTFPAELAADLGEPELTIAAWQPLLLLNLAAAERIVIAAEYELEPGRIADRTRGTGLGMSEDGDDVHTWEVPAWGPYQPSDSELDEMLQSLTILEPLLLASQDWQSRTGADRRAVKSAGERLRRSAQRLLMQGPRLGVDGDVIFPRDRAEVIFWFMSALENLLVPDSGGEYTRKVAQRTAILIGVDHHDRLQIYHDVISSYSIRSKVAHGDVIPDGKLNELPAKMYGYLREVFRALIILGPHFKLDTVCDEALLSEAIRLERIAGPLQAIFDALPETNRSLRPRVRSARRAAARRRA